MTRQKNEARKPLAKQMSSGTYPFLGTHLIGQVKQKQLRLITASKTGREAINLTP